MLAASPISASFYIGGGLLVLALVIFAETGLLIGFFLPGDTLLLLAGLHTKSGQDPHFSYLSAVVVLVVAAILGAQTGFAIGRAAGPRLFDKPGRQKRVAEAQKLLHRFGESRAVIAARFVPAVRTFMNPAVGITGMSARSFVVSNVVGAVLWVPLVVFLGRLIPDRYAKLVDVVIVVIIVVSLTIALVGAVRERQKSRTARS